MCFEGCGKTTLLTVLADQVESTGKYGGEIYVNGEKRDKNFRRLCAYVMQSDHLLESLTVREILWFTAELRLGAYSNLEKMAVVKNVLRDLDLVVAADRRIAVLSGGQKRRVTVAIELVAMPSLVFLDEPTSGLDASGSLKLIRVLRKLADAGRTIVCTIHQPRVDAFRLFHMVFLMNAGTLLYFGPMSKIVDYFTALGDAKHQQGEIIRHESVRELVKRSSQPYEEDEEEINPADFVLDMTRGSPEEIASFCEDFQKSKSYVDMAAAVDAIHSRKIGPGESFSFMGIDPEWFPDLHVVPKAPEIVNDPLVDHDHVECGCDRKSCCNPNTATKYASTNLKQTFTLTRRALVSSTRNGAYIMSWVLGIIMMLFMGMLYSSVNNPKFPASAFATINTELNNWGACTQNLNQLAVVLNTTVKVANQTLLQCGQDLTESAFLSLARTSLLYQLLASMFFSEMPLVANIHQERNLYFREHASRSYSSLSWTLSWIVRIAFSGMLKGIIYPPFVYFSAQLTIAVEAYFLFCIFMGIMSIMGASMALLVSVIFESFETASVAFVVINIISQNLCGYFIGKNFIPWWFRWIYYMNFFSYTFEGTVLGQQLSPQTLQKAIDANALPQFQSAQNTAWLWALIATIFCVGIQLIAFCIVQLTGRPILCRGLRGKSREHTKLGPPLFGGGFVLTKFNQKEVTHLHASS